MTGDGAAATAPPVAPLLGHRGLLTEGPRWHAERGELLWVDILGRASAPGPARRRRLPWSRCATITLDRHVGAVAPATGGGYVLAAGTRLPARRR